MIRASLTSSLALALALLGPACADDDRDTGTGTASAGKRDAFTDAGADDPRRTTYCGDECADQGDADAFDACYFECEHDQALETCEGACWGDETCLAQCVGTAYGP